nr:MAG TPA: hypothetical protein [Caudoviricetes sp.]
MSTHNVNIFIYFSHNVIMYNYESGYTLWTENSVNL